RGVTIGTVSDITLAPDRRNVQVTSDIYVDAMKRLGLAVPKKGEQSMDPTVRVQLVSAGITGVRFLQADFFDPERYPPPVLSFAPPWTKVPPPPPTERRRGGGGGGGGAGPPPPAAGANPRMADLKKPLVSFDGLEIGLNPNAGSFTHFLLDFRRPA